MRIQPLCKVFVHHVGVPGFLNIDVSLCTISQHVDSDMLVHVCCLYFKLVVFFVFNPDLNQLGHCVKLI